MHEVAWSGLARNALWIVGLGIVLAAASHASWRASAGNPHSHREARGPTSITPIAAGLLLVTFSLAWGATVGWERALWVVASLALACCSFESLRRGRGQQRRGRNLVE